MAKLAVHPLALAFNIFGLLVWVIALGGTGGATYSCQTTNSYEYCAKTYQWEWWNLWFEFALLVALFITSFIEQAFKRGRLVFLAFFVMVTQGIMWSAHDFITTLVLGPIMLRDIGQDANNAATAGFVLLGMTNFVLIIVLGKDFGYDAAAHNSYQQTNSAAIQFQTSAPV
ncbi:hypothetical protein OEZ85_011205 [Tetradesmus obliquus]|uniref:Uncharacterized protein n=1 Tax=Tetradesmus obliquus TaxID=3088 RepID=A0ABY8TPK5_TETOB|nr:hypothetical protein OEZ85_011205 [Tetradesmus obliquus]